MAVPLACGGSWPVVPPEACHVPPSWALRLLPAESAESADLLSPEARLGGDRKALAAHMGITFPGHQSHQICRLCARGRACPVTQAGLSAVAGERVERPPSSGAPPSGSLLQDPARRRTTPLRPGGGRKRMEPPLTRWPRGFPGTPGPACIASPPAPKGLTSQPTSSRQPPGQQGPHWAVLGGARLRGGALEGPGEQPRGKPQGRVREEGLVGGSPECRPLPSLALAGPSLAAAGK